jgi:O-antigen/teichoic acid export membrane protein
MREVSVLPSIRKRLLSGGLWSLMGKVVGVIAATGTNALLARLLSPEELGAYFLGLSFVTVGSTIALMGLQRVVVRLVAESFGLSLLGRAYDALKLVFRYGVIGAFVVAGVLASGLGQWISLQFFHSELLSRVVPWVAIYIVVVVVEQLLAESYRGFSDVLGATLFGDIIPKLCLMTFLVVAAVLGRSLQLHEAIILLVISGSLSILIGGRGLGQRYLALRSGEGRGQLQARSLLSIGLPMLVISLTLTLFNNINVWVLGYFRSEPEIALYSAALRLVNLETLSLTIVNAVLPPIIAELYSKGEKQRLERVLRGSALLAGLPALIGTLILAFGGRYVLNLVYSEYYTQATTPLIILGIGRLVGVWAGACQFTLMMTGREKIAMLGTIISGILCLILSVLLVPTLGVNGAAIAFSVSLAFQNILMLVIVHREIGIWTHVGPPGYLIDILRDLS